jgi:plastocyanin
MNKYFIIIGVLVVVIVFGFLYRAYLESEQGDRPTKTGKTRDIGIVANQNRWEFEPDVVEVDEGDTVRLTVVNQDSYDHGFAIDAFGISQRMPANGTIQIEFTAIKAGDFPYYCSVSCGSGEVDGKKRGHFDQIGKLHVRSLISETQSFGSPREQETVPVSKPEEIEENLIAQALSASMVQVANEKAVQLGYNPERLSATFDHGNQHWMAYHTSVGYVYREDTVYEFLERDEYSVVYYSASGKTIGADLWIFIDEKSGDILGVIEE